MSKIFGFLFLLLFLAACEKSVNSGYIPNYTKYPTSLNKEWEYNTSFSFEFYDSTGRIDSTEVMDLGNTICRIASMNDTLANYSNLVLFEEYDVATPNNVHKLWYLNSDSGLYAIAYFNPGASQTIVPKANISNLEYLRNLSKTIGLNPSTYNGGKIYKTFNDSIQFYNYPRRVLKYPLRLGERWVELVEPFYRERFVNKKENFSINGTNYNCFKVESEWDWGIIFNDFINFSSGLVMRELIVDSAAIISRDSHDIVGYYRFTSTSKLVRETRPD